MEDKERHGAIDFARAFARHCAVGWFAACYETGAKLNCLKDFAVFIGVFLIGATISAGAYVIGETMAGDPQNDSVKSNLVSAGVQVMFLFFATLYITK